MMKNIKTYSAALLMAWAFASCSDFLDTVPDNRAEIDTESKVTSLLVSAYPNYYPIMMFEQASDNTADNGEMYGFEFQQEQDAYLWSDIKTRVRTLRRECGTDFIWRLLRQTMHCRLSNRWEIRLR